ncbi:MAG: hypothetical protein GY799_16345 [Desulfobulbaceae bacterium]|nr:hypothetical protein [Desulfobulbaceae bacterium]
MRSCESVATATAETWPTGAGKGGKGGDSVARRELGGNWAALFTAFFVTISEMSRFGKCPQSDTSATAIMIPMEATQSAGRRAFGAILE